MENLKANCNFSYGKLVKKAGDKFEVNKSDADKLIHLKLAEKVKVSHKEMDKK